MVARVPAIAAGSPAKSIEVAVAASAGGASDQLARMIQAATYYPQTIYFDRHGKVVFDHAGPYASASALEQDIRRYGLG